jgi:Spy/CpxP family protein refolding chaperone
MKFAVNRLAIFALSASIATALAGNFSASTAQDQPADDGGSKAISQLDDRSINKPATTTTTAVGKPVASVNLPAGVAGGNAFKQPYGFHLEPILKTISATADQRKKISSVVQTYRPRIQPLREQYNQKRDEFLKSVVDGKEAEVIMTQQVELGRLHSDIISQYTFMRLEIRRFLSPNQTMLLEKYRKQQGWR